MRACFVSGIAKMLSASGQRVPSLRYWLCVFVFQITLER